MAEPSAGEIYLDGSVMLTVWHVGPRDPDGPLGFIPEGSELEWHDPLTFRTVYPEALRVRTASLDEVDHWLPFVEAAKDTAVLSADLESAFWWREAQKALFDRRAELGHLRNR